MSNLKQSADDARRLLRGFKAFEEVATALDNAATLEQRESELKTSIEALSKKRDRLYSQTNQAEAELSVARGMAKETLDKAKADADVIVGQAIRQAADLTSQAKNEASTIVSAAQAAADTLSRQATEVAAVRDKLAAEVKDLEARAEKAQAYLKKLAG